MRPHPSTSLSVITWCARRDNTPSARGGAEPTKRYVPSVGIEPTLRDPQSRGLSISLRGHTGALPFALAKGKLRLSIEPRAQYGYFSTRRVIYEYFPKENVFAKNLSIFPSMIYMALLHKAKSAILFF